MYPRLEYAPDLPQATPWITDRAKDQRRNGTIELRLSEWQRLDSGLHQRHRDGSLGQATTGLNQHRRLVWLDGLHALDTGGIVEREVLSSTGSHFQHDPLCLADECTSHGIESTPDQRLPHQPVVQRGKTAVGNSWTPGRWLISWFIVSLFSLLSVVLYPLPLALYRAMMPHSARGTASPYALEMLFSVGASSLQGVEGRKEYTPHLIVSVEQPVGERQHFTPA